MGKLRAFVYKVKTERDLFTKPLDEVLINMAGKLDSDSPASDARILNSGNKREISIWFDSIEYRNEFLKDGIPVGCVCFLLAKDLDFMMIEDKEKKMLNRSELSDKWHPKIPSHCVFLSKENILIMEKGGKSATINEL
ncbi:hypothetical protein [Helicobacter cetorum]|uniref:Uncharacterized protein n=1 Tax=Helicobacter cetorum (strain ATCC BAA-540 / CCUG 52418 / MIT 99-5656) TaxID=1163745 RepID=I0EQD1_HELCM|nr:hypothetical protein [Helicobacter cetorum]AFI05150.1 hypothetical protein HCD_00590 [Helicobacter cetorum MIT 99-5656]